MRTGGEGRGLAEEGKCKHSDTFCAQQPIPDREQHESQLFPPQIGAFQHPPIKSTIQCEKKDTEKNMTKQV